MPAPGTIVNGRFFRRPGSRSTLVGDALAGGGASPRGILAVVYSGTHGEPLVPTNYENATAFEAALPTTGPKLSPIIWGASKDSKVTGAPTRVVGVRVDPAAQSTRALQDSSPADVLTLTSKGWGAFTKQIWSKVEAGTDSGTLKYTIGLGGETPEVFDNVGLDAFSVERGDGATAEIDRLLLSVGPAGVTVVGSTPAIAVGSFPWTPTMVAYNGDITIEFDQASLDAGTTVTVKGTNEDGPAQTVVVVMATPATSATTGKTWTEITEVSIQDGGSVTTITLTATAFDLPVAEFPTIKDVVGRINSDPTLAYDALLITGKTLNVSVLDTITSVDCVAAAGVSTANLQAAEDKINLQSSLVSAARVTNAATVPATTGTAKQYLTGGTDGTATNTDWQSALAALEQEFINVVVCMSDSASIAELLRLHVVLMAGEGGDERNGYCGAAAGETLATLYTRVLALNNRNLSLCAQEIQVYDAAGTKVWRAPEYTALLCAAIQCSSPLGTPLTWKKVNVLDFRQNAAWNPHDNGEEALEKGLLVLENARTGIRIVRQLTTFQESPHEVYCEISRNESANESVKNVRRAQEVFVGDAGVPGTRSSVEGAARAELERQVRDKEISDYGALSTVKITLGFHTSYALITLGATTFINTTAYLANESAA